MRLIEVCNEEIRAVAVSPDGRFVGASADRIFRVFDWITGAEVFRAQVSASSPQIAFTPDGWVAFCVKQNLELEQLNPAARESRHFGSDEWFTGGVAVSPDGKHLVAASGRYSDQARLVRWALPAVQSLRGFDCGLPFRRLAFSPDGHYLAGISPDEFELRYAASGGYDHRQRLPDDRPHRSAGFVSFTRDSALCAFGWENEFHIRDISTGTSRALRGTEAPSRRGRPRSRPVSGEII